MHVDDDTHITGITHAYTALFAIICFAAIATWIIPAGQFERSVQAAGSMIVPNTYKVVDGASFGFIQTLSTVYRGMVTVADTVFFVFIAFASISVVVSTGAFHALIARLLSAFKGYRQILVIPIFIFLIGMASSTIAVFEEMFPFIPLFVAVAVSMKYDALVGMSIVALGIGLGYSGSFLNPFTIGIAQSIAGLPPFSGALYRFFCHVVMVTVASGYVMIYAIRISLNPRSSLLYGQTRTGVDTDKKVFEDYKLGTRHGVVLIVMLIGIVSIIFGVHDHGWYFEQISAVYLLMAISSGLIMGWPPDKISHRWAEGAAGITSACLKIALAKGVIMILQEAKILDTIIYWISTPLLSFPQWVAAEAMLLLQTIINFFVPSGSGQAVVSMPIMVPLADVLGISRQTTVLAFQFGDGISNIFWLTGAMPIICKFAKVPPRKWLKFFTPLFCLIYAVQMLCIAGALVIGY
jgi:uncharacterized ion transporter superfamily protein YfcC